MSPMKRYAKRQAKAIKRRRLNAQQRLRQQRAEAQRSIEAIHQALADLGFSDTFVAEIEGRLQTQQKLLGKIVGLMFPTLFGCRQGHELTRVRGWNKNIPTQLLGALPKRSWLKRLRRLGLGCSSPSGAIPRTKAPRLKVAGNGDGVLMIRCFENTANILGSSAGGGADSSNTPLPALMGCCYSWS